MSQTWTVIIKMSSGQHHITKTDDVENVLKNKRALVSNGYFHQKKNLGEARIVFCVKGNHELGLKKFGAKKFLKLLSDYNPLHDAIGRLI